MQGTRHRQHGLSLPELLVVIGITAVLIALLLPALGRVRRMSRSTACLSNLQQWGQSFQMYLNNNKGQPISEYKPRWWDSLGPYHGNVRESLLCPEAREPRPGPPDPNQETYKRGSAAHAYDDGNWRGSYGMNIWAYDRRPHVLPGNIRFPARQAKRVPLLVDCVEPWAWISNCEVVPSDLQGYETGIPMSVYCLDRHAMAVNVVFLDGHAEHVPLAGLWKLKWSEEFLPLDVTVPRK